VPRRRPKPPQPTVVPVAWVALALLAGVSAAPLSARPPALANRRACVSLAKFRRVQALEVQVLECDARGFASLD